jgi:superfamily I DNA/RNA helicase
MAKEIYGYLKSGPGVKRGGKKMLNAVDDGEWLDKDELIGQYGLRDTAPWETMFQLPDRTRDTLVQLDNSGALDEECRVKITTIHAVKGAEADNVVLLPDMSYFTETNFRNNPDDEHRVFYVGCTRAKKNLFLHIPLTERFYPL